MKTLSLTFVFLLFFGLAFAEEKDIDRPPYFYFQGSTGNNSGLAMRCVGDLPYKEIDCSFTQVSISADTPTEAAKKKKESAAEMEKVTQKDIAQFKKDFLSQDLTKFLQNMKSASDEQKAYMQDFLRFQKSIEKVTDKASLKKFMYDFHDFLGAICTLSQHTFDYHFTRVSRNKWLYNPGPVALCNVVRIATLENMPDHPNLWTYTETVVTADQDETCKEAVEIGKHYTSSWDAPKSFKFEQCKYIQFGS